MNKASHDHDHDHDHDHGHDHDHDHGHTSHDESTHLLRSPAGYGTTVEDHSVYRHHDHASAAEPTDVNIQAAYLHVITDLIQSIGVAIAGLLIWIYPEYQILDPICTFLFSGLVIW
jgi:solute carrier family 30 (zinc transporter), member 2